MSSDPRFRDEEAAYAWVEARLWPNGPVCPLCERGDRVGKLKGRSTRIGVHKCYWCRKPFRATAGTVVGSSRVKLHVRPRAFRLMTCSKKGVSSDQLHRTLGLGLRAAWFLSHRVREAMRSGAPGPAGGGGGGGIVEADETCFGRREHRRESPQRKGRPYTKGGNVGPAGRCAIVAPAERGGGKRSFHVGNAGKATANLIVANNVAREARAAHRREPAPRRRGRDGRRAPSGEGRRRSASSARG